MSDFIPLEIVTRRVVGGGYCVGCGACAAVPQSPLRMKLNEMGQLTAYLPGGAPDEASPDVAYVCPFSGVGPNEDEIASGLFAADATYHPRIGFYRKTFAGYVAEGDFRSRGSSGGMGSWISAEMLQHGLVDAIIHTGPIPRRAPRGVMFEYSVSRSLSDLKNKTKSHYHPVEFSQIIQTVREQPGNYAFVGVPCFVKAIRLLCHKDPLLASRIRFAVGLVCGHLKSIHFASMFSWQCGVHPDALEVIDFRHKIPGADANRYGVRIQGRDKQGNPVDVVKQNKEFFGYLWGHGFFKYESCDYCDDVLAETADLTIGDAWLPQYVRDSEGTNIVVVRNAELEPLIQRGRAEGRLVLDDLSPDDVARSQDSNFRHRRNGLRYRLYLKRRAGQWFPSKRVRPAASPLRWRFRRIHQGRMRLAALSHRAFQEALKADDFGEFVRIMKPLMRQYDKLYRKSFIRRAFGRCWRILRQWMPSRR